MSADMSPAPNERELILRYATTCRECQAALPPRSRAVWDRVSKTARCVTCSAPAQQVAPAVERLLQPDPVDFGTAGASAQRLFEQKERRRRAQLRARWWVLAVTALVGALVGGWLGHKTQSSVALFVVVGAFLPVAKLVARPQHIAAWRTGAVGEQQVGRMLDGLRDEGVVPIHDRRVPNRRTNIDHIAVSPAGVFVIDTKNVAGRVSAGRNGLRVAGRRQDKMITGAQSQVAVVREALSQQGLDPTMVRGVLCFTKADLPWIRPSPGGVLLHYPRGLRKELRQKGVLAPERVQSIAELLARRLPPA